MSSVETADFGQWMKAVRVERGLSQSDLAEAVGFDQSYVGRIERGDREPTRDFVVGLAIAFKMAIDDVLLRANLVNERELADSQNESRMVRANEEAALQRLRHRLARMSPARRAHYLRMIEAMLEAGESGGKYDSAKTQ